MSAEGWVQRLAAEVVASGPALVTSTPGYYLRMLRALLTLLLGLLLASCGGGRSRPAVDAAPPAASRPAGTSGLHSQLQGTWELVSFETFPAAGPAERKLASGRLTFDQFANIAVHAELDPAQPGVAPPRTTFLDFRAKATLSSAGAVSYVGTEQLTPAERMAPEAVGPSEWARLEIEGETLRLSAIGDGGTRLGTLTFRKVG